MTSQIEFENVSRVATYIDPFTFKDGEARKLYQHLERSAKTPAEQAQLEFTASVAAYVEKNLPKYTGFDEALRSAYMVNVVSNPNVQPPSARTMTNTLEATWKYGEHVEAVLDPVASHMRAIAQFEEMAAKQ